MTEPQKQDELRALGDIVKRLEAMTAEERQRAIAYLFDRYSQLAPFKYSQDAARAK